MAITRCTLSTVRGRLIAAVNAAPSATWATTTVGGDARRNDTELDNIILAADARICVARASKVGDGYRTLFLSTSVDIFYGDKIPDHLGPIEQVTIKFTPTDPDYKAGIFDPSLSLSDIERWRANAGSRYGLPATTAGSVLPGFYIRRGSQLFFTGYAAKVQLATFTRSGVCAAPETDEDMLLGLALAAAIKEGDEGPYIQGLIADARAQYAELVRQIEPSPSETVVLAA